MLNTSIVSVFCFYGPRFQKERITMFGKQSVSGELQVNKESTLFSNLACYFVIVKWGRNNLACRPGVIFWHITGDCKGKGEARGQCGVQVTCGGIRMQKKAKKLLYAHHCLYPSSPSHIPNYQPITVLDQNIYIKKNSLQTVCGWDIPALMLDWKIFMAIK